MRIVLTELLHVVSINLEPGDDAQIIFETLNARGTPLLAMDLVKNAVFHRAEREDPAATDALHHDVWEPELGRSYWREEQRQGRLKRPRAELFLMHWLTMRLGEVVAAGELFSTFRARVLGFEQTDAVAALIRELCADAGVMRGFDAFPPDGVEGRFFRRLAVLDTTTVLPVVLHLFRDPAIDVVERRRALAALESWLVRRMICGLTTKNYNRVAVELLEVAGQAGAGTVDAVIAKLDGWDAPTNRWPRDNEIEQVLATRGMYGWIAQRRLVLVLAGVEARRRESAKTEAMLDPAASLSLEHLMPQKWIEHWPELDGVAEADRDRRLHLLGNLTLVTSPLNGSLSNSAWAVKRGALADHSLLLLNSELAKLEHWTDAAIDARCASLAKEICAVWQRPPTDRGLPSAQVLVTSERRSYSWTIADLIAAGKLTVGEELRPCSVRHTMPALVAEDGTLEIEGEPFTTPSGAAKRVSGTTSEAGWRFWCVQRNGARATLAELREELGEAE